MPEEWRQIIGQPAAKQMIISGLRGEEVFARWERLAKKWSLERLSTFNLGIHSSVQKVRFRGQDAVLKIFISPGLFQAQLAALQAAPSEVVAEILELDGPDEALLMEFIPGSSAVNGSFDPSRAQETISAFHSSPCPSGLNDLVEYHLRIARQCSGIGLADQVLARAGFFRSLNRSAAQGLVHGDAYPENIIISGPRVCLIDPTGYHGDQAFDWATLALYSPPEEQFLRVLNEVSALSGYPAEKLAAWAWLRAALSDAQDSKGRDSRRRVPSELEIRAGKLSRLLGWE